jgi:hypothetical protein
MDSISYVYVCEIESIFFNHVAYCLKSRTGAVEDQKDAKISY